MLETICKYFEPPAMKDPATINNAPIFLTAPSNWLQHNKPAITTTNKINTSKPTRQQKDKKND